MNSQQRAPEHQQLIVRRVFEAEVVSSQPAEWISECQQRKPSDERCLHKIEFVFVAMDERSHEKDIGHNYKCMGKVVECSLVWYFSFPL